MLPVWYSVCSYDKSCVSRKLQWWRVWGRMSSLLPQDQCQRKKILRDKPTYAKSTWTKHTLRCRYFFSHYLMKCGHCYCNESLVYCRKGNKIQSFHFAPRFSYYTTKASSFLKKLVCSVTPLLRRKKYFPGQSLCLQFWRWELQLWWENQSMGAPSSSGTNFSFCGRILLLQATWLHIFLGAWWFIVVDLVRLVQKRYSPGTFPFWVSKCTEELCNLFCSVSPFWNILLLLI